MSYSNEENTALAEFLVQQLKDKDHMRISDGIKKLHELKWTELQMPSNGKKRSNEENLMQIQEMVKGIPRIRSLPEVLEVYLRRQVQLRADEKNDENCPGYDLAAMVKDEKLAWDEYRQTMNKK